MYKKRLVISLASLSFLMFVAILLLLFIGPNGTTPTAISSSPDITDLKGFNAALVKVASEVRPVVVNISTTSTPRRSRSSQSQRDPFWDWDLRDFFGEDFFKRFEEQQNQPRRNLGSGVIIDSQGYILTNNHVVANADKITVTLNDKKEYEARVVGTDKDTDVAVIQIDTKDLPVAKLGSSDKLQVGEIVLAVGSPLGLSQSVTMGIISATGRSNVHLATYEDFIQTDASINPGNSGGPLVNIEGEVIGINTAIATAGGSGNIGIGFAIPINMALNVMEQLTKKGKVVRGWLGIRLQEVTSDLAEKYGLKKPMGVLIASVSEDGPAAKAGLKAGDLIIEFNGDQIEDGSDLRKKVAEAGPDETVKIKVIRDNDEKVFNVKLSERTPEAMAALEEGGAVPGEGEEAEWMGLTVQTLTDDLAQRLGYKGQTGVLITDVDPEGPAAKVENPPQRGDLIQEIEYKEIKNISDYRKAIESLKNQNKVLVRLRRANYGPWYVLLKRE